LGVANDLLENFLIFVDDQKGLGLQISGRLKEAYAKEWDKKDDFNGTKEVLNLFGVVKGGELALLRLTSAQLNEWIHQIEAVLVKEVKTLEAEKKTLDKEHAEAKAKYKEAKETRISILAELQKDQEGEGGWVPTPLRVRLQQEGLKPFLIEKAAYWGKLVGNGCRRLFGNATAIFDIIKYILVEEATISKMVTVGVDNVEERCRVTRDAMILFDGFFGCLA
jgi:hypothetical protein